MSDHPYGWFSLLPPLAAIVLAITTRRVILSLLCGVFAGAVVLTIGNPPANLIQAVSLPVDLAETHLWSSLSDGDHLRIFAFTLIMGAMVNVIQRSGGMRAIVDGLAPLARSRRGGQLVTWALGLIIFFDDYANTLLFGGTMRPLADRLKISREKLAYLVDSTAAPVAGLAVISTWVAGEIGFINEGFAEVGLGDKVSGLDIFIETIPYRFYVLFALAFVPMVGLLGRDFGPMLTAERDAVSGRAKRNDESPVASPDQAARRGGHWLDAVCPIVIMLLVTVALLVGTGWAAIADSGAVASPTPDNETSVQEAAEDEPARIEPTLVNLLGNADSYVALLYGSLAGLLTAFAMPWVRGILSFKELGAAALEGARHVLPALAILWLAWSLSNITTDGHLGTGTFLAGLIGSSVPVVLMPTIVFLLASLVSFATGTSWGTMGILMPLVVRVTYQMLGGDGSVLLAHDNIMLATIGSVLAGSIFGDHCSPISDTTVLSSMASGCNHVAHVRTQLPYALLVGVVSIALGTLPIALGISCWILLPAGVIALAGFLLVIGRRLAG